MNLSRRQFVKTAALLGATAGISQLSAAADKSIRIGAPLFESFTDPQDWVKALRTRGYGAAYCPVKYNDPKEIKKAYREAARAHNIVIAEVGAWSNPISRDETERQAALQKNIEGLILAEEMGANCCVNIAGSRGASWAGPHRDNLTRETFEMIVDTVRTIIDSVKPTRTFYTLEMMPFTIPDSVDSYLNLIKAIDRPRFACHLDPVNLINSPYKLYNSTALIKECFARLGPYIKSCHAKDIVLLDETIVQFQEVMPGKGELDYAAFLNELAGFSGTVPLMIEHLSSDQEYRRAADYIRQVGQKQNITFM